MHDLRAGQGAAVGEQGYADLWGAAREFGWIIRGGDHEEKVCQASWGGWEDEKQDEANCVLGEQRCRQLVVTI